MLLGVDLFSMFGVWVVLRWCSFDGVIEIMLVEVINCVVCVGVSMVVKLLKVVL